MASLSLALNSTPATTSPVTSPRDRSFSDAGDFPSPRPPDAVHLPRAASYSFIPHVKDSLFEESTVLELKAGITEEELTQTSGGEDDSPPSSIGSGDGSPEAEKIVPLEINRRSSLSSKRASRLSRILNSTKSSRDRADSNGSIESPGRSRGMERDTETTPKRSLSNFRRKSWMSSSSRSTSPTKAAKEEKKAAKEEKSSIESPNKTGWSFGASRRKSFIAGSTDKEIGGSEAKGSPRRKGTVLSKRPKRPSLVVLKGPNRGEIATSPSPRNSPAASPRISSENIPRISDLPSPPLPKSFSSDRLPSLVTSHRQMSSERVPPLPRTISMERLKVPKPEMPRRKDELWGIFRELDAAYQKFQSKSIALKPNVVRSSLLPFLREYAVHPSNQKLRAEDLDRRTNILNKWWTGLLDALAGKNNQSVTGTDRYAILDGIVGVMERPEWRLAPPLRPLISKGLLPPTLKSVSSTSLSSNSSDFLVESVQHNVRNIFVENILAQLSYVVDHMSLRQAPASLVSFAGKTLAYGFMFCPGIADILVRLWGLSLENVRRVVEIFGASRASKLDRSSRIIMEGFPPELKALSFVSLSSMTKELRKPAPVHVRTSHVNWNGPWLKRWSGKESDLFYVFVKHYHLLLHDFLPEEANQQERLCTPGIVLIHAQLLSNLDATVHRHSNPGPHDDPMHGPASVTFDDLLDPDATAAPLPMSPTNATRLMPQNRLIMLLREFLSENGSKVPAARRMFADSFCGLLKACAKHISLYDSQGTHTLCDFLEEAFDIIIRYENGSSPRHDVLDWPFWISVWERMAQSHNTSTEIKLYSFLYTIWTKICYDETRRYDTCINFLLAPEYFESKFNHWCPMVRAYYMRLVCWRVGRFDGEAGEHDADILARLQEGLSSVWAHYMYLRDEAAAWNRMPPSTTPCAPAPGRRLLIIRTDAPISQSIGPLLTFDSLSSRSQHHESRRGTLLSIQSDVRPPSSASTESAESSPEEPPKGKWGLLGKVMSLSMTKPKPKPEENPERPISRLSVASTASTASNMAPKEPAPMANSIAPLAPQHQTFCFRFSLEWTNRNRPIKALPPSYRLEAPRLPAPAQMYLQSSGRYTTVAQGMKPVGLAVSTSRYAGRALAEWQDIINEYQNFFARRRFEGVPRNSLVETPGLSVENFRRSG